MGARRRLALLTCSAVASAIAFQGACSSEAPAPSGPVARFSFTAGTTPAFFDVPWPSDAYLKNGTIVDPIPGFDAFVTGTPESIEREMGKLDGFSRITHALFLVDDPDAARMDDGQLAGAFVDRATLPASEDACIADSSSVFLVDLEATDPSAARVRCRAAFHDDRPWGSDKHPTIAVGPARGIVLREGHRYAAVLTSRVKDASGRAVGASEAFTALAGAKTTDPVAAMYQDGISKVTTLLGSALSGTKVVAIAPFTTHTRTKDLFALRETLEAEPIPKLSFDSGDVAPMGAVRFARKVNGVLPAGFTASLDDWLGIVDPKDKLPDGTDDPDNQLPVRAHDHIAAWGTAVFEASYYLQDKGGYEIEGHATFARDGAGKIIKSPTQPTQKIWVSVVVPDAPMPKDGYPLVIVQHGLGASREYLVQNANVFASKGWMVVAIDSITFGARSPHAEFRVDQVSDYEKAPGATYAGPDGISDVVGGARSGVMDLFGNLTNLGAFRDQLRQASIDTAQLVRVLRSNPDLSFLQTGAEAPRIDPSRVSYLGESLGSVEGEMASAIEPNVKTWVFSVGGGGFIMEAATHGPGIGSLLNAGAGLFFHFLRDHLDEFHPLVNLVQTVLEPADPLLYGQHLIVDPRPIAGKPAAPRNVMLIESLHDELLANEAGEAFGRTTGLVLAEPNVGSNAGTIDPKTPASGFGRVPFKSVGPDGTGTIHDVPFAGITGVIVQFGPCDHGSDFVSSIGAHEYAIPFARYDTPSPFVRLDTAFTMRNPYREIAAQITDFFADGFAGKVPGVIVKKTPVRDYDDDGVPDDLDKNPSDPTVK